MKFLPITTLIIVNLAGSAAAKLPEPDAVFRGTVQHLTSSGLLPVQTNEIAVVARIVVNGVTG